jgi:hypothetical protein
MDETKWTMAIGGAAGKCYLPTIRFIQFMDCFFVQDHVIRFCSILNLIVPQIAR